ncbi:DnaD domain protein [Mycoplasma phocoenae]|uniref:DnaD domain-containing protein n=1 Tax=Mycoplasma phocoenae TaxID=754517 RepID=A0A858U6X0_9MOLU|nr:DnaD domain protein [Mycoplasma phocoenae]QJG67197.1 hypothetical protein HGG69_02690 [Mycoplasma phocoenae]
MKYSNFYIEKNTFIDNKDLEVVRAFYMPIIGNLAVSFYHSLLDELNFSANARDIFILKDFEKLLFTTNKELIEAKNKLEAVGLIKFFESDLFRNSIITICKPLNCEQYKNSILAKQLINKIGEERYEKLIYTSGVYAFDKSEYTNSSKKVTSLFKYESDTFEMPNKINEKISNTMTIQTKEDWIKNAQPSEFIKYLTNLEATATHLHMIQKMKKMGFGNGQINQFINYSVVINGNIVSAYIEKIANSFAQKQIFYFEEIQKELQAISAYKEAQKNKQNDKVYTMQNESFNEFLERYGLVGWDE